MSARLTVNAGLRWDYRSVPYETNDRMGWRDLSNPRGGLLVADQTLVERGIVGDSSYYKSAGRRNPNDASKNVFAPRLGFAFRPFGGAETVVRGGYGVFWDSYEGREIDGPADIYPYVSRGNYIQTADQTTPLKTTNDLFPSFADLGAATPAANTFLAVSMSPEPKNPYVQQWSLGVQREIVRSTIVELNYIGTKGTNLLMRRNIAQALPYDPANPKSVAERKPYPNFVVYIDSDFSGTSNYNAMNAKLERHTSRSSRLWSTPGRRAPTTSRRQQGLAARRSMAGRACSTTAARSSIAVDRTSTSTTGWSAASCTTCRSARGRRSPATRAG